MMSKKKFIYIFYGSLLLGSIISRWLINFSEPIHIIFVFFLVCFYFLLLKVNFTISVKKEKKSTFYYTVIFQSIILSVIIILFLRNYYPFHLNEKNESLSIIIEGSFSFWIVFFIFFPMFVYFSKLDENQNLLSFRKKQDQLLKSSYKSENSSFFSKKTDYSQTKETIESESNNFFKIFHLNERTTIKFINIIAVLIVFILPFFPMSALVSDEEKGLTLFLLSIIFVSTFVFLILNPIEMILYSINSVTISKKNRWMYIVSTLLIIFCAYVF